jgi:hypothetical protein
MVMLGSVATAEQEKFWLKVCLILLYEFCRNFLHVGGCSNIGGYCYAVPGLYPWRVYLHQPPRDASNKLIVTFAAVFHIVAQNLE